MTPETIAMAVAELAKARTTRAPLDALPEACRPTTAAEGYAVQKAFIAGWPDKIAGWKAGATLKAVQERFGLAEPFLGPMFAGGVMQAPVVVKAEEFDLRTPAAGGKRAVSVEVEFAFRFGRDLAPKAGGYKDGEVLDAVEALVPAVEIITPRFKAPPVGTPGQALADCGLNGGIVLGKAETDWRGIDLPSFATKLVVDGKTAVEGTGALVLGDPRKSLVWLVNAVTGLGHTLSKGQVLTTGSMSGITPIEQGSVAVGDYGRLGQVEVRVV
ncbi:MAG: hydratase [Proteobacteria bacterium]|nr:hydratase [Pseudomonadota bacterium]